MYNGIILVDKPTGWTSFDVVAYIRKIVVRMVREHHEAEPSMCPNMKPGGCRCKVKVGHTGTLDPLATGLLQICIGTATKQVQSLIKQDKTYEMTAQLGSKSDTGDSEGMLTQVSDDQPSGEAVKEAVQSFVGDIEQTPPQYSAIKVNGKKAYEYARAGETVELKPRQVKVYSIDFITYEYPYFAATASVSSGTYIRTLIEDIGKTLKTGAHMTALRRTRIGEASIDNAITVEDITREFLEKRLA